MEPQLPTLMAAAPIDALPCGERPCDLTGKSEMTLLWSARFALASEPSKSVRSQNDRWHQPLFLGNEVVSACLDLLPKLLQERFRRLKVDGPDAVIP